LYTLLFCNYCFTNHYTNIITVASGPTLTICLWISIIKHSECTLTFCYSFLLLYEQAWCWLCDQKRLTIQPVHLSSSRYPFTNLPFPKFMWFMAPQLVTFTHQIVSVCVFHKVSHVDTQGKEHPISEKGLNCALSFPPSSYHGSSLCECIGPFVPVLVEV